MQPLSTYTTKGSLSVDCKRALEELYLQNVLSSGKETEVTPRCWEQGSITSFCCAISYLEIPGGSTWHWNQSGSRVFLTNNDSSSILVAKLCPKRRGAYEQEDPPPSYKLWIFELQGINSSPFSVLWCERGSTPLERSTNDHVLRPSNDPNSPEIR